MIHHQTNQLSSQKKGVMDLVLCVVSCVCDGSYPAVGILSSAHTLKHSFVQAQLQTGLVKHLPLVAVPGDQTVYFDGLGLTDSMTPGLSLEGEMKCLKLYTDGYNNDTR